jgi:hypothetical protein
MGALQEVLESAEASKDSLSPTFFAGCNLLSHIVSEHLAGSNIHNSSGGGSDSGCSNSHASTNQDWLALLLPLMHSSIQTAAAAAAAEPEYSLRFIQGCLQLCIACTEAVKHHAEQPAAAAAAAVEQHTAVQAAMVQQLLGSLLHQLGPAVVEACEHAAQRPLLQQDDCMRTAVLKKFSTLLQGLLLAGNVCTSTVLEKLLL